MTQIKTATRREMLDFQFKMHERIRLGVERCREIERDVQNLRRALQGLPPLPRAPVPERKP